VNEFNQLVYGKWRGILIWQILALLSRMERVLSAVGRVSGAQETWCSVFEELRSKMWARTK
jgi:hypothetical protein